MSQVLQINNLTKRFGKQVAVDGVSLNVNAGEFLALLGPSGCGKTTLLRCLAGLENPTAGELVLNERIVYSSIKNVDLPPQERGVGFVFQDLGLWPNMTVLNHLLFVLKDLHDKATSMRLAREQLNDLHIDHLAKKKPAQLSGGESQRLALSRALVTRPAILLLDEPLASLDRGVSLEIREILRTIKSESGTTMIYVTHSREEAMELGDRVAVMQDGVIEQVASPQELYAMPDSRFVASFLGDCNVLLGAVEQGSLKSAIGDFRLSEYATQLKNPTVIVRDHQIEEAAGGIAATIVRTTFCGRDYSLVVDVGGVRLVMRSERSVTVGEVITIRPTGNAWFVEGNGA